MITNHVLNRKTKLGRGIVRGLNGLQQVQDGRAVIPGSVFRGFHHVVTEQSTNRDNVDVINAALMRQRSKFIANVLKDFLRKINQVNLIDSQNHMLDTEQTCNAQVTASLSHHTVAGIHQQHHNIRS